MALRQLNFSSEMTVLPIFQFESQLMQKPGPRDIGIDRVGEGNRLNSFDTCINC